MEMRDGKGDMVAMTHGDVVDGGEPLLGIAASVFSGMLSAPARPRAHGHGRVLAAAAASTVRVNASTRSLPLPPPLRVWEKLSCRVWKRPAVTSFEWLRDGMDHSIRSDGHVTSGSIADQTAVGHMGS
jgi:hypothetical protein